MKTGLGSKLGQLTYNWQAASGEDHIISIIAVWV
jgi:hypothetical protein